MMMSQGQRRRTESHVVGTIRFLGEQDGAPEREFKEAVARLLGTNATVERGYLARVAYESSSNASVAVCLVARDPQDELLQEIGSVFASMFGRDQHLDILFISRDQEQDLARVCSVFFESNR
jgi:hypothetical protein